MKKALLTLAGAVALLLGIIGIILPGLPTTPFVLLAAYCFAQASPTLHRRLKENRLFGRMISDWERDRALTLKTKLISSTLMMLMVMLSVWHFAGRPLLQAGILALGLIGSLVVWRIPTRPSAAVRPRPES